MGMTIIKDYKMPHNCYDCDLHNYHECDLTTESIEEDYCWNGDSREKHCPLREVEAIPKADYENRLKADMVAMLTEIQLEFEENTVRWYVGRVDGKSDDVVLMETINDIIQQKINALKAESEDT